jgi:hypothetical protein
VVGVNPAGLRKRQSITYAQFYLFVSPLPSFLGRMWDRGIKSVHNLKNKTLTRVV